VDLNLKGRVASSSSVDRAGDSVRRSADTEPNGSSRAERGIAVDLQVRVFRRPARLQALAAPDSVLIASTNEGSKGLADTSRPLTRAREGASKDKLRLEC
jgi:hypothetical protein